MRVYITGVSKGLGKALAEHYLSEGNFVTGIGRHHNFDHPNFSFIHCELRKIEEVLKVTFSTLDEEIILINNAGIIGNIQRLSEQERPDILEVMTVNTLAPMYLCHQFLRQTPTLSKLTIVNISSGAAINPIPSWASYCASKSAIDRFSETIQLEELEKGRNVRVLSVAPGVIDTNMQVEIRSANVENFSKVRNFIELQERSELLSTKDVVRKLVKLLNTKDIEHVVCSLKTIE